MGMTKTLLLMLWALVKHLIELVWCVLYWPYGIITGTQPPFIFKDTEEKLEEMELIKK